MRQLFSYTGTIVGAGLSRERGQVGTLCHRACPNSTGGSARWRGSAGFSGGRWAFFLGAEAVALAGHSTGEEGATVTKPSRGLGGNPWSLWLNLCSQGMKMLPTDQQGRSDPRAPGGRPASVSPAPAGPQDAVEHLWEQEGTRTGHLSIQAAGDLTTKIHIDPRKNRADLQVLRRLPVITSVFRNDSEVQTVSRERSQRPAATENACTTRSSSFTLSLTLLVHVDGAGGGRRRSPHDPLCHLCFLCPRVGMREQTSPCMCRTVKVLSIRET